MTTTLVRAFPFGLLGALLAVGGAQANPQGGTVVGGQATITQPAPNNVTVKQQSSKAIINWRSFSVGGQESVLFKQPSSSSVALNRVTGNDLSTIAGSLSANGIVFLVNPNGVVFTRTAKVDVNGMIATTNDIANNDFMAGKFNFAIPGTLGSSVVNQGKITATQGGLVGLVAPSVRNDGIITARLGRVTLASGDAFTVDLYGDQLVQFAVPAVQTKDASSSNGPLVSNTGTISASGGTISLTADTAARIVDEAINTKGLVEASAVHEQGGEIVLDGGPNGGVAVAGTLDASGKRAGQTGGTVKVLGANVALNAGTKIDVSGYSGGGTALIGGNFHGVGPEHNAATTIIAAKAAIDADALTSGNGGQVAVWSDQNTTFNGSISARGGVRSGNGGFVEVSGHQRLAYGGAVDLRAPVGLSGTLLLDPENVTISATGDTPTLPTSGDTTLTGTADNSVLSVSTLENALKFGNVTVQTGTSGTQAGDIEVASTVGWTSGNSLTLSAFRNITVDNGVTIFNIGSGSVSLRADNTGTGIGTVAFNGTGRVDFTESTGAVSLFYNPADNPAGSVINSTGYTSPNSYAPGVLTNGSVSNQLTAYMLVNSVFDLQNIQNNLNANFSLGKNIDATVTNNWNNSQGFIPLGNLDHQFEGNFDGNGHEVTNLSINSSVPDVGLFGFVGGAGSISDVGIVNGNVNALTLPFFGTAGELVGTNFGKIINSYSSGQVRSPAVAGGLVGANGSEENSGSADWSGPVSIVGSFSTASVTVGDSGHAGGLIGTAFVSAVSNSYSAGSVSGGIGSLIGGLIGSGNSTVTNSYAASTLKAGADSRVGGIFGTDFLVVGCAPCNVVANLYWDTQKSGTGNLDGSTTGGFFGVPTAQLQSGMLPAGFDPSIWTAKPGQYPILNWQLTTTSQSGVVNFGAGAPPTLTPLTWSVANSSSTYGTLALLGSDALFGVAPTDSGAVTGTVGLFKGSTLVTLSPTLSAGTYTEEVTNLTGSAASKYTMSPTGDTIGTLTINPKTLTWMVANASSTVGSTPTLGAVTLNGLLNVDSANVFGAIGVFNGSTLVPLSNAIPSGSYTEKVTALTGLASPNYTLAAVGNTPGALTITSMTPPPPPPPNNNSSLQQQQVLSQTQSQIANASNSNSSDAVILVSALIPTVSTSTATSLGSVDPKLASELMALQQFAIGEVNSDAWKLSVIGGVAILDKGLPILLAHLPASASATLQSMLADSEFQSELEIQVNTLVAEPNGLLGGNLTPGTFVNLFFAVARAWIPGHVANPYEQQAWDVGLGLVAPVAVDYLQGNLIAANVNAAFFAGEKLVAVYQAEQGYTSGYQAQIDALAASQSSWAQLMVKATQLKSSPATDAQGDRLLEAATQSSLSLGTVLTNEGYGNEWAIASMLGQALEYKESGAPEASVKEQLNAMRLAEQLDQTYYGGPVIGATTIVGSLLGLSQPQTFEQTAQEISIRLGL